MIKYYQMKNMKHIYMKRKLYNTVFNLMIPEEEQQTTNFQFNWTAAKVER